MHGHDFDGEEVRVLGSLVEKAVTTPEYYPLTLNALINACNQKSNRDPMVSYDEATVADALVALREKGLVRALTGERAMKYREYFAEAYHLTPAEAVLLDELMLRGAQTVAKLRGRIERFGQSLSHEEVERLLEAMELREDARLVVRLPRQPGHKEARYAHLLAGEPVLTETVAAERDEVTPPGRVTDKERLQKLEEEVAKLREELQVLQQQFIDFSKQFE